MAFAACVAALGLSAVPAGALKPDRVPSDPSGFGSAPAGIACAFPVTIDLVSGDQGQLFTFYDQSGNVVREAGTARASVWRITNDDTGTASTVALPGGHMTVNTSVAGITTLNITGGAIGFNAPTDNPAGPFSFTNVGHLTATIDANGNTTSLTLRGKQSDLCALVAP